MTLVRQFLKHAYALEVFWLVGFREDAQRGWQVLTVTRDMETERLKPWPLPIGMLPLLAPGRVFIEGCQSRTPNRGCSLVLRVDDVGAAEEVTTKAIPPEVFSFGEHPTGIQHLLRYCQGDRVILVPTVEMVRYLFLHNKTMANALMRSTGIMELFSPEAPGFYPDLHLRFTRGMPRNCLSDPFASEFAWTAVDLEGRHSWDSVRVRTAGQPYVSFTPPHLFDSVWAVRAIEWKATVLVLEINSMSGKRFPCDRLRYSHPSIREAKPFRPAGFKSLRQNENDFSTPAEPADAHELGIDVTAAGSRTNTHQTALHAPAKMGTFDRTIPIERVILKARSATPLKQDAPEREKSRPPRDRQYPRRLQTSVSVAEEDSSTSLPPIEFRLLEPAGPDDLGELEPMMAVVRLMAKELPAVHVASSLCLLKPGRAFSTVGRCRRPCLIAIFTPKNGIPLVLVSVDHSGEHALSSLALIYRRPCGFFEMEKHLATLLDGLVENGGSWEARAIERFFDIFFAQRYRKVLCCREKLNNGDYLAAWAAKLGARLGLSK
ncbi:hypothetical protein [Azospirillum soli]|uniref:hypothetical protein n=1 Tax=Azospirillum soli TaxID=1304799 RepID=UPI001AE2E102|nr:hypothetical protein [Azospirillum soli]MBP2316733.1 hypothetical protein [Azospirillum soli]